MAFYYLLLAVNVIPCTVFPDRFPIRNASGIYLLVLSVCLVLYYSHRVSPAGSLSVLMKSLSWMILLLILLRCVKYSAFSEVGGLAPLPALGEIVTEEGAETTIGVRGNRLPNATVDVIVAQYKHGQFVDARLVAVEPEDFDRVILLTFGTDRDADYRIFALGTELRPLIDVYDIQRRAGIDVILHVNLPHRTTKPVGILREPVSMTPRFRYSPL